ncbi:MAG TPA: DUF6580 family putative transport protein [Opitutaceae bacterium]|nr:DUF6580 family putative transport protein [Opitutaceae bacterium]
MRTAIALILLATGYRIIAAWNPDLVNFSPLMALAFCGGVYFRNRWMWLIPFVALSASDLYLDHYHASQFGYSWDLGGVFVRTLCFAAALLLGWMVARRKSWLNLGAGCLGGALLFFLATNTASFLGDAFYAKTLAGWWQAMTVGHPEFPPTLLFFRNTLASDLLFTGIFVLAMESAALRAGQPSLLTRKAARAA